MNTHRRIAIVVGALFLISYGGVFIGSTFVGPVLDSPDYLMNVYPEKAQVILGVLIELINEIAVIGIAVLLFPILRKYGEGLTLGYVGFRLLEAAMYVVGKVSTLSLINISQEYIAAGTPADSHFQTLGAVALAEVHWAGQLAAIFFMLGAVLFYYLLYQSKLVPRFIPIWGLIGVASLVTALVAGVPDLTKDFVPAQILYILIVLNELFIAVWLIVKGFNPSALESEPT